MQNVRIDVGANSGHHTELLAEGDNFYVIAFEPATYLYTRLKERFRGKPNIIVLPFAVDVYNVPNRKFNVSEYSDGGSSSLYERSAMLQQVDQYRSDPQFGKDWSYQEYVPTMRLDALIALYEIESIDFLHIDAQGNDLNVLRSLGGSIDRVKAGRAECTYKLPLYNDNDNTYPNVKAYLESFDFKTDIEYVHGLETEVDIKFYR